MNEYAQVG